MSNETFLSDVSCRLCGATQVRSRFTFIDCEIQNCANCGFFQLDSEPGEEMLKEIYGNKYFAHSKYDFNYSALREHERRRRLLIDSGLSEGAKILEIGCATGDFVGKNVDLWDIWGIDISSEAIEQAQAKYPDLKERFSASKLDNLEFEEASYDAIIMWDVIEHLYDPVEIVNNLSRFIKSDGLIALSTPNIGALTARIMGARWAFMTPPEHMCFFNRSTIETLLKKCGFKLRNWKSLGKWSTLGFVLYKISRVFQGVFSDKMVVSLKSGFLGKIPIYIPTQDIQYAVAKKK